MRNIRTLAAGAAIVIAIGVLSSVRAQTVTGSIAGGSVARGNSSRVTVYLNLPAGLHANSSRPGSEYAIPTSVRASAKGARVGRVAYPRGRNRKFDFSTESLNVYEGRVPFTFDLSVPANYRGSSVRVNVTVKYQACTNEVCYAPTSKQITLNARVS